MGGYMRLRNKKTGEIKDWSCATLSNTAQIREEKHYASLAELNEDWEDYKPVEPLIKDEKIRKAVRAWAEANEYDTVLYDKNENCIYSPYGSDNTDTSVSITFDLDGMFKELEHRRSYTIAEICGEEKE